VTEVPVGPLPLGEPQPGGELDLSLEVVTLLVLGLSILVRRPRPFGVPIEGDWTS
jgi:hypothetical protein